MEKKNKHGGKRAGSGQKKMNIPVTIMRVPVAIADQVKLMRKNYKMQLRCNNKLEK